MSLKPDAAEIATSLSPRERWRLYSRYRRERDGWLEEAAIGDPLGLVETLRQGGHLADLQRAIMLTKPQRGGT